MPLTNLALNLPARNRTKWHVDYTGTNMCVYACIVYNIHSRHIFTVKPKYVTSLPAVARFSSSRCRRHHQVSIPNQTVRKEGGNDSGRSVRASAALQSHNQFFHVSLSPSVNKSTTTYSHPMSLSEQPCYSDESWPLT